MKIQPPFIIRRVVIGVILLSLTACIWCFVASRAKAPSQAINTQNELSQEEQTQDSKAVSSYSLVSNTKGKRSAHVTRAANPPPSNAFAHTVPEGSISEKNAKKADSMPAKNAKSAVLTVNNGNNMTGGGAIAPGDIALLLARAVEAQVVESEENDPKEVAVLAAQDDESAADDNRKDLAAIDVLSKALDGNFNEEDKADFLALASDASERSGVNINSLVAFALNPDQPLVLQRQALYLATNRNIDLVTSVAEQSKHPLQQDAQSFLLENELAHGRRPATTDDDITLEPPE
ncbi:MAG: hypothetical protein WC637_01640 [Victivallales bacterium]|jgi:hypothetical protein